MGNSKCRACGAEIIFVKTRAGKSMPCNPQLIPYWIKSGAAGKIVTINGDVRSCEFEGLRDAVSGFGRISHFATCPAAGRFRRK